MAHTKEKGDREMPGEEAEHKTFHTSPLDSSPGTCFIALTTLQRGEMSGGKDALPV